MRGLYCGRNHVMSVTICFPLTDTHPAVELSGFRTSFTPAAENRPAGVSRHSSHPYSDGPTPLSRVLRLSNNC